MLNSPGIRQDESICQTKREACGMREQGSPVRPLRHTAASFRGRHTHVLLVLPLTYDSCWLTRSWSLASRGYKAVRDFSFARSFSSPSPYLLLFFILNLTHPRCQR